ncbi:MAG: transcription factor S [Thermoplasmata archaeon]
MFCPKCNTLLYPEGGKMVCRKEGCGYSSEIGEQIEKSVRKTKKEKSDFLVLDEIIETLPQTTIECPSCHNNRAYWMMRQTRGADEPTTRIYRCTKCSHTWREF